ncbi:hypothetical protein TASI_1511 [Taylorella asinigenitalis MCE3]|uniref:Uncharacterized protein n=1 Tax=Taylorella asinigenitalis (strain MCE3) TaxID=1008459 RepID=G4QBQ4_TAYAM|nr:hypothetical protein TASI_1511 [Taylorella asinigenitalis MCE3]
MKLIFFQLYPVPIEATLLHRICAFEENANIPRNLVVLQTNQSPK